MRFLIAGSGSIGQRHLHNLLALGESDIVLYRTFQGTLQNPLLDRFPFEHSLEAALDHQPDAVIVSNPTRFHLDIAIPAARAGCHLLLEKPVADSMERVPELVSAVQSGGGQVLVGYHFRHHPAFVMIRQLLDEDAIGSLISVRAHWGEYLPGWHPWEDYRLSYSARSDLGGGVILTLSHPLDYLHWLVGEAESLWSFSTPGTGLEIQVDSVAEIGIRFRSGVLGSLHLDYCQQPAAHRLEVIGSGGTIYWNNEDGIVRVYRAIESNWKEFPPPHGFNRDQLFLSEMRHFLEVVRGEAQPACTLEDGVNALKLCLAAVESQRSGLLVNGFDFG